MTTSEDDKGQALTDAAMRVIVSMSNLTPGHRAAFEAAALAQSRSKDPKSGGPPVAAVWDALHELVLAVRVAVDGVDPERLAGLHAQKASRPLENAARTLLERSPDVARLLGIPQLLDPDDKRST